MWQPQRHGNGLVTSFLLFVDSTLCRNDPGLSCAFSPQFTSFSFHLTHFVQLSGAQNQSQLQSSLKILRTFLKIVFLKILLKHEKSVSLKNPEVFAGEPLSAKNPSSVKSHMKSMIFQNTEGQSQSWVVPSVFHGNSTQPTSGHAAPFVEGHNIHGHRGAEPNSEAEPSKIQFRHLNKWFQCREKHQHTHSGPGHSSRAVLD